MQRPDVRSTIKEKPTYPVIPSSAGITLSRMCAIASSMDEGCAWIVVLLAYMICLRCDVEQRLDGAAGPLHSPPVGKAWQWVAGASLMDTFR
jgi:hypothetical protein